MPEPARATAPTRVGWGFVALYTMAYAGASSLLLASLLVSLALKVNTLAGIDRASAAPRQWQLRRALRRRRNLRRPRRRCHPSDPERPLTLSGRGAG